MDSIAPFRFDDKMNFDFHARRHGRMELNPVLTRIEQAALIRRLEGLEKARTTLEYIAAHTPPEYRQSFLNLPAVREVMQ